MMMLKEAFGVVSSCIGCVTLYSLYCAKDVPGQLMALLFLYQGILLINCW